MSTQPKIMKDDTIAPNIKSVRRLLDSVPPTYCTKSYCANWCCTKLAEASDKAGNFMSLPLIYNIEYYAIAEYIQKIFTHDEQQRMFYPKKKPRTCVFFRDKGCAIYPVRPFSCRVYGRSVPDVFWGIEYPKGSAQAIDCPDCQVVDEDAEHRFLKQYRDIWNELYRLSTGLPVVPDDVVLLVQQITGMHELLIMGWCERNELLGNNQSWYRDSFANWWNIHSQLM